VDPINDSDRYSVFVYQYNDEDFCKKTYAGKVTPKSVEFFSNLKSKDDPYSLSEKKFTTQKGNTYYISVLNTSINNCGHYLYMQDGVDTLRIKALHIPCKRDVSSLSVKTLAVLPRHEAPATTMKIQAPQKDSVPAKTLAKIAPVLTCIIKNKKTNALVNYQPQVTHATTQETLIISEAGSGMWSCSVEPGSYKIKCTPLGFKPAALTIQTSPTDTTRAELLLEPLKEGEAFILKSIYFHPNTYALRRESAAELQKLLTYLANNENVTIEIQGHTNGDHHIPHNKAYEGLGEEWNFKGSARELSMKRAEAIKKYLVTNGVPEARLVPKGYGGKAPIIKDPQNNEEGQMNIRVEVLILKT
jgi:outer membrane protein OmpA-like peptidoglycan-associated protein